MPVRRDAGTNESLPQDLLDLDHDQNPFEPLPVDADGNHRVYDPHVGTLGGTVDMGAFEYLAAGVYVVALPGLPTAFSTLIHKLR